MSEKIKTMAAVFSIGLVFYDLIYVLSVVILVTEFDVLAYIIGS